MIFIMASVLWAFSAPVVITPSMEEETIHQLIEKADRGDVFFFKAGRYVFQKKLKIFNKTQITLKGESGTVFDGNTLPPKIELRYPECPQGLIHCENAAEWEPVYLPHNRPGTIDVVDSEEIRIVGIAFSHFFPNAISLRGRTSKVFIESNQFYSGTNSIYANGSEVGQITVTGNSSLHDKSLWDSMDWAQVHHGKFNYFNGAFFQARNIGGEVTIKGNTVQNAFNGVRIKTTDEKLSAKVAIEENIFRNISDNVIEPERSAGEWIVKDNMMFNVYAPFSFDHVVAEKIVLSNNTVIYKDQPRQRVAEQDISDSRHHHSRLFKMKTGPEQRPPKIKELEIVGNYFELYCEETNWSVPLTDIRQWPEHFQIKENTFLGLSQLNYQGDPVPAFFKLNNTVIE